MNVYQIRTRSGISYNIEATSLLEARARAEKPDIRSSLLQLLDHALQDIQSVEPVKGPAHTAPGITFPNSFFAER